MASWTCLDCTYANERAAAFCGMCAAGRPSISHAPIINLCSPNSAERKNDASTNKQQAPGVAAALAEQQEENKQKASGVAAAQAEQQEEDAGEAGDDELLPAAQPAEERCVSNPFSSFVYDDTTVSTAAPLRAFAFTHAPLTTAKRPLSKLLSGGGGGGGGGADDAPKKKTKKQQQPCGEGAPEDFDKESADIKEATVLKWRRILGPVAKRTWTGNNNSNNQGGGGGEGGKEGEADTAVADPATTADDDPANLYRFRLLVAVILSSRTQEQIVRQAIEKIAQCYPGPQFSPRYFASSIESWETLSERLSFVHCNKVKSRHILQTASIIEKEFRGQVPRRRDGLLRMAGIGPTLAPLLDFLFAWHEKAEEEQKEGLEGKEGGKGQGEGKQEREGQVVEQQQVQEEQQQQQWEVEQEQPPPVQEKKGEEVEKEGEDDDDEIIIVEN